MSPAFSFKLRGHPTPRVPYLALDTVWFQVSGTLCNLACEHCFISSGPTNHDHEIMTRAEVRPFLEESEALGAKDFYFTGGEPFLNRELPEILEDTLRIGPATVLTNATLITRARAEELSRLAHGSRYSLEARVSLDGLTAESNDPIRGTGSFEATLAGIRELALAGFDPIITATQTWDDGEDRGLRERFHAFLNEIGLSKPRFKVLPLFRIGREATRTQGYARSERLTEEHMRGFDPWILQCSNSRMVTSKGVYVCPILINVPGAKMGRTLKETLKPFPLAYGACHTCWATGASCRN
jgi:MoaA/NifB/PqqE/SkfB family radical SAM enzyme